MSRTVYNTVAILMPQTLLRRNGTRPARHADESGSDISDGENVGRRNMMQGMSLARKRRRTSSTSAVPSQSGQLSQQAQQQQPDRQEAQQQQQQQPSQQQQQQQARTRRRVAYRALPSTLNESDNEELVDEDDALQVGDDSEIGVEVILGQSAVSPRRGTKTNVSSGASNAFERQMLNEQAAQTGLLRTILEQQSRMLSTFEQTLRRLDNR